MTTIRRVLTAGAVLGSLVVPRAQHEMRVTDRRADMDHIRCSIENAAEDGEDDAELKCKASWAVPRRTAAHHRIRLTLLIPSGRDAVVIEHGEREAEDKKSTPKFLKVDSGAIVGESRHQHVELRPGEGGDIQVELWVQVDRCAQLTLTVREYLRGDNDTNRVRTLSAKRRLPKCCGSGTG